jgi:hypothetical protein
MMRRFGDRATFAVELGEVIAPSLRGVDLWAGGKWLTTHDNEVFVSSFVLCLRSAAAQARRRAVSLPGTFAGGDLPAAPGGR